MASSEPALARHMTYSKCRAPLLGALVDYVETCLGALGDRLLPCAHKSSLSARFLAALCLALGAASCVTLQAVTPAPPPLDLHLMLLSREETLYIDDIDASRVMWCIEASDLIVLCISCLLIWNSSRVRSPLSEYLCLPWVGACLRGLLGRQAPTAAALLYTTAAVSGAVDPLFLTSFCFLFLLEARMWVEVCRELRARWERRRPAAAAAGRELETLWSNDDVQSVEVHNYVY